MVLISACSTTHRVVISILSTRTAIQKLQSCAPRRYATCAIVLFSDTRAAAIVSEVQGTLLALGVVIAHTTVAFSTGSFLAEECVSKPVGLCSRANTSLAATT